MPIKKEGRFEFSHEEIVHTRNELSTFLMRYVKGYVKEQVGVLSLQYTSEQIENIR